MSISIPYTRYKNFQRLHDDGRRWGQALYDHLELNKVVDLDDREWCDRLYNADDVTARKLVESVTDYTN